MGIRYFVFAVNKMDLAGYDEEVFNKITGQIEELKKELSLENVQVIPLSATEGDNVTVKSENIPWYKGEALLPYLENIDVSEKNEEQGFYMPVQRVCRPNHSFRGFQGQIESGSINVGDELITLPSNEKAHVKEIIVGDKSSDTAFKGQPVTITLDKEVDVSRGCVLVKGTNLAPYGKLAVSLLCVRQYLIATNLPSIPRCPNPGQMMTPSMSFRCSSMLSSVRFSLLIK